MPLRIQCSSCKMISQVPDDSQGKMARCPRCGLIIQVPLLTSPAPSPKPAAATPAVSSTEEQSARPKEAVTTNPPSPPKPPLASRPPVASEHIKPGVPPSPAGFKAPAAPKSLGSRPPGKKPVDDEAAEAFRFDRDESSAAPALPRKRKSAASNLPWILLAAGGGLVLVLGAMVAFLSKSSKPADAKPLAQNNPPSKQSAAPKVAPAPTRPDTIQTKDEIEPKEEINTKEEPPRSPSPPPKQVEVPSGPTPASIDVAATRKVKKATTYLKVTMGNGQVAEGSGFFAAEPGLVFTNAHVLGMLGSASGLPTKVDVVVNSGEPEEFTRAGQVLGVDRASDLGLVRVQGTQEGLPDPLPVDTTRNLSELQKVYIFGFPFGSSLGKNITVSESSVSSLRKDPDGTVNQVQVNGGMNPGNSGGPVVDARGVVVGVAVAIIKGTQINFAVPGDKVQGLLRGRVADIQFGEAYLDNSQVRLPIQLECLDPLSRLRELKLDVWTGEWGPARPMSGEKPAAKAGDGPRQTVPVVYRNGKAAVEIPLPTMNPNRVLWVQPVLTDGGGVKHWAATAIYRAFEKPPLERKAVTIQQRFDSQSERTVKWTGLYQLQMSKGPKHFSFGESLDVEAVEIVNKAPTGGQYNLFLANSKLSSQVNDSKSNQNLKTLEMLRGRYFTFTTDGTGHLKERSVPTLAQTAPPQVRMEYSQMVSLIAHSYEMTCLSMPNREVKAKESWQAVLPLILMGEGRHEVVDMVLTCTYEGSRQVKGRTLALIALAGNLKSRRPGRNVGGKVVGKAHFAVDGSYVSDANLKVESEAGDAEANATHVIEVTLTRVPGNTLGVAPTPPPPILVKGKALLDEQAMLAATDPTNHPEKPGAHYKLYSVNLNAGTTYIIEMNRTSADGNLDPYLVLRDPQGQKVAEDDDGGGDLNARIVYRATQTGAHQVCATAFQAGETGPFRIVVSEASTFDSKMP